MKVTIQLINEINEPLVDKNILKKIAKSVLKVCNQKKAKIGITVFYVDEEKIQQINKEYRAKDKPTDVISFRMVDNLSNLTLSKKNFPTEWDYGSNFIYIGEIFICASVAKQQAEQWQHSVNREVAELFAHGMLHLLGYDHEKEEDREKMKEKELLVCEDMNKFVV